MSYARHVHMADTSVRICTVTCTLPRLHKLGHAQTHTYIHTHTRTRTPAKTQGQGQRQTETETETETETDNSPTKDLAGIWQSSNTFQIFSHLRSKI